VLGDRGRVLVRYSGTESLRRLMVGGGREPQIADHAATLAGTARRALAGEQAAAGNA
jgi:phosphomannomutase